MPIVTPELPPAAPAPAPLVPDSPVFLEEIRKKAITWARECGFKPPLVVSPVERQEFSQHGHGYVVIVQESNAMGKRCRMASARFNSEGNPSYWSQDGIVTG